MFRQLTNFRHQRSAVQAIGFYLFYLVTGVAVIAIAAAGLAAVANGAGGNFGFDAGYQFGSVVAIAMTLGLTFLVLHAKGLLRHIGFLLVGVLSVAGAAAGGLLLGLIFVAFLTTRPAHQSALTVDAEAQPIKSGGAF